MYFRKMIETPPISMNDNLLRPSVNADPFGRYYTSEWIGSALIKSIPVRSPSMVIDLGSGGGALTGVAAKRWGKANIVTVDSDARIQIAAFNRMETPKWQHFTYDALDQHLSDKIKVGLSTVDVAICNPPYIRPKWKDAFGGILEEAGLTSSLRTIYDASADVLFIAQNLRFLRKEGRLGIILPDGIISGEKFSGLRKLLLDSHKIESVTQLPRGVFSSTEVQTHLLVLQKQVSSNKEVTLKSLSRDGKFAESIRIPAELGSYRLDFGYHNAARLKKKKKGGYFVLGKQAGLITRGTLNSKVARECNYDVFHTDCFPPGRSSLITLPLNEFSYSHVKHEMPAHTVFASPGDILLARVGRNFNEKVCQIKSGWGLISDCVFLIRVSEKYRQCVFKYLRSDEGRDWLCAISRGTSARYITLSDLRQLRIPIAW
jgi:type I restriction enzyme M protein